MRTFDRIALVAREMNHFLWKQDRSIGADRIGWWNCADHAAMTGALFLINGSEVDAVSGEVFFAQSGKSNGASPCLHRVPRHWWVTVRNIGVVDLSPDLSVPEPNWDACNFDYVFGNKVFAAELWQFHQANTIDNVNRKLQSLERKVDEFQCIYLRHNVGRFDGAKFLAGPLVSNQKNSRDAQLTLLSHLDKILRGTAEPLYKLSSTDAWAVLSRTAQPEIDDVLDRIARAS